MAGEPPNGNWGSARKTFFKVLIETKVAVRIRGMSERLLSVLVIDDQKEILDLVRLTLKPLKWTVNVAKTPQEGLALARSLVPDVILCDAAMPKMSGPEVIQILKTDPATAHIPVVLITGAADSELFAHVPWTNFLAKPFSPRELRDAIYSASAKPRE